MAVDDLIKEVSSFDTWTSGVLVSKFTHAGVFDGVDDLTFEGVVHGGGVVMVLATFLMLVDDLFAGFGGGWIGNVLHILIGHHEHPSL